MTYLAFRNDILSNIKNGEFKNLLVVDVSSGPTKVNQVLKISTSNLFKLSPFDLQTAFSSLLKQDPQLFTALLVPLFEMEYAK